MLEKELVVGRTKLGASNERVRQLTAELEALNERIKNVNNALADPSISEEESANLMDALLENVQLTLTDVEIKLSQAVAEGPPQTVGQRVINAITDFIQAILRIIFPSS
jgi:hypothetical protein